MKDKRLEERIQHSLNAELSGFCTSAWQRERCFENATGGRNVKRKIPAALVLAAALLLLTVTALAAVLLSPREIVEEIAVPMAQGNTQENYSYDEMKQLITALNENGITLDEGSRLMQAFHAGHGFWERDAVREICLAAFGADEGAWSVEQKHWHGEMMVAIGAYGMNVNLIPGEGDMSIEEARAYAVRALKEAYGAELPEQSDDAWTVYESFSLGLDLETGSYPPEKAEWGFVYNDRSTGRMIYSVNFGRTGGGLRTWKQDDADRSRDSAVHIMENPYPLERDAIREYGDVMYFWPPEVLCEVYGEDYAVPSADAYDHALMLAEQAIAERYGSDALERLGKYQVGLLHREFDDAELGRVQHNWDFMFTTDPEYLSDGYRVQFVQFLYAHGREENVEWSVEMANMGNG